MKPTIKKCNHDNKHRKRLTNFLSSQKPLFDISRIRHLTFDPKLTPPLTLVNVGLKCEKKLINYSGGLQLASSQLTIAHCHAYIPLGSLSPMLEVKMRAITPGKKWGVHNMQNLQNMGIRSCNDQKCKIAPISPFKLSVWNLRWPASLKLTFTFLINDQSCHFENNFQCRKSSWNKKCAVTTELTIFHVKPLIILRQSMVS